MNTLTKNVQNQGAPVVGHQGPPIGPVALLPRVNVVEILRALRRRLGIVALCSVVTVLAMVGYLATQPVLYASHGSVQVKTEAPQIFDIKPIAREESRDLEQMRTVADGMLASTVLLPLVEKYGLAGEADFADPDAGSQTLLDVMRKRVTVELRRGTRLIDISVEDSDPERAALMVEGLVREYEIQKDGGHSELIASVSAGLEKEEARLRLKMEESEALAKSYRTQNPLPGLLATGALTPASEVEMINKELIAAKTQRIRLQSEYEAFQQLDANDPNALAGLGKMEHSDLVIEIERELGAKEIAFAKIKERYLHKHPVFIEAVREIESLKKSLGEVAATAGETLKKRYTLAVEHEGKLLAALEGAKGEAVSEESVREAFAKLSRQAQIDRDLHASVAKRLRETQIGSSWNGSFLRWEDKPLVAGHPVKPHKKALIMASLVIGVGLGLFFALIAELVDRRVRESAAVERVIGVPVLATLPNFTPQAIEEISNLGDAVSPQARPMALSQFVFPPEQVAAGKSTMLFTSAFKNDGKSVSAIKCARTLARQGHRTLLIDADFHDSGLSRSLAKAQGDRRHGLAAYLMEEAKVDEVFYETGSPGLWFVPTGSVDGDPSALLSKLGFKTLLESLSPMFDRIVIDASSVVDDSDVQSIVRHVDATCLVVRKHIGRYRDIQEASDILRSAGGHLVGFVWNEVDRSNDGIAESQGASVVGFPSKSEVETSSQPHLVAG